MGAYRQVGSWLLVAPPLDGPPTGGTLYNRALVAALRVAGLELQVCARQEALRGKRKGALCIIDSLYLPHAPELKAAVADAPTWLLLHYLPAQVRHGRAVTVSELSGAERDALAAADGVIATSPFMAEQLRELGVGADHVVCVEPGVAAVTRVARADQTVRALVLGSVTEAKGQLELLRALARDLRSDDALQLDLAGSLTVEPEHVTECRALIAAHPPLAARVVLHGELDHEAALELLARTDLLVSVSRMESYGMALSEARAAGVPIIARAAGNVAAHVRSEAGGTLCMDADAVARELLALTRDRHVLAQHDALARTHRLTRSWPDAAAELVERIQREKEI